jgi:transcription initiation factor IIE alpha subunit
MVTIHKADAFRVFFYSNEHEPVHVHIERDSGVVKINLFGPNGDPELVEAVGMKRSDIRRAMEIVAENRVEYLERWRTHFG